MSIRSYTCVNYFMSVLVANVFSSKFDCRPRPLYRPCISSLESELLGPDSPV